jgi:methionine aminopeptidase
MLIVGIGFYFHIRVTMRQLISATGEAFEAGKNNSEKPGQLLGEIAAAAGEQTHGIEQVNSAVSELVGRNPSTAPNHQRWPTALSGKLQRGLPPEPSA